ncbi:glycoside hydrolase [Xylariaceae sp. AK1471]|nr:glycoside hydrolase [Xylariaceae sp. AK1471]
MGLNVYIAAILAAVPLSQCHFAFVRVALNGEWQAPTRFVRNKTAPYFEDWTPNQNYNSRAYIDPTYASDKPESIRCGRGNMDHAADTEVLTVRPGDTIEVAHVRDNPETWAGVVVWDNCPYERGSCYKDRDKIEIMDINHPGPFLAHLSKVPDGQDVHAYDGSGDWVKIYTLGLEMMNNTETPVHWLAWDDPSFENDTSVYRLPSRFVFNIPKQTPQGQYLLRLDMSWPGQHNDPYEPSPGQIYATCAQIQVDSDIKDGTLPKGIRIPEDMSNTSPGMRISREMQGGKSLDEDYVYAGGPLWDGVNYVQDKPTPRAVDQ